MKKRLKTIFASAGLTLLLCAIVSLAVFIPLKTKADDSSVSAENYETMVSTAYTNASEAVIDEKGGSVFIEENGYFLMNKGVIEGENNRFGGAVYVSKGATFDMIGGTIRNNSATFGGAIYVEAGGICNISSAASIIDNAAQVSSAIHLEPGATLNFIDNADKLSIIANNPIMTKSHSNYDKYYGNRLNYYVDGSLIKIDIHSLGQEVYFDDQKAPYSNAESIGYYDNAVTVNQNGADYIKDGKVIFTPASNAEVKNVYTRKATNEKFTFTEDGSFYNISALNKDISGEVVFPLEYNGKPVKLAYEAFEDCVNVTGIFLSYSIKEISALAFSNTGIQRFGYNDIYFADKLGNIGISAFNGCSSLNNLVLPTTITDIGRYAFYECSSLTSVVIPSNVTHLSEYLFGNCSGLTEATISDGVESIAAGVFDGCDNITSFYLPSTIKEINTRFELAEDDIGPFPYDSIVYCGFSEDSDINHSYPWDYSVEQAYYSYSRSQYRSMKYITISGTTVTASTESVYLVDVKIPEGIKIIDTGAFSSRVYIETLELPTTLERVNEEAFYKCTKLISVVIPENVSYIGVRSFANLSNLQELLIMESDTALKIANYSFRDNKKITFIKIPKRVNFTGTGAFFANTKVTEFELTEGLTELGTGTFYGCYSLKRVKIPNTVTAIKPNMFYNCTGLESVYIPSSVVEIWGHSFFGCTSLMSIYIPSTVTSIRSAKSDKVESLDWLLFEGCSSSLRIFCGVASKPTAYSNYLTYYDSSDTTKNLFIQYNTTRSQYESTTKDVWNI